MRMPLMLLPLLALATACGGGDQPVGGLSAEEAAQLNNAAEMLDASADDLTVPPGGVDGNADD